MIEFYPEIRLVHISTVLISGALFFLRGLGVYAGAKWPMAAPVRYLSYSIDMVLLTAALMLTAILRQYPFVDAWLTAKVLLLTAYVALGAYALKRGRTRGRRLTFWVIALAVYGFIISIARSHSPLGLFASLAG